MLLDKQVLFVFKVGHSVYRRPKPIAAKTHHWRCYVDSWSKKYPLSAFVKKIVFRLHETFENPRQIIRQSPFAIEEDGFGNFQLQIEVAFLDLVTAFTYDITLYDQRELHAFRTVRVDPTSSDWATFTRLGGIAIPKSITQADVQQVLKSIQTSQNPTSLHAYSFFPNLIETDVVPPRLPALLPSHVVEKSKLSRPIREARSQALVNLGMPKSHIELYIADETNVSDDILSSKAESVANLSEPTPTAVQKHKKKLQLKHEAQMLSEQESEIQKQLIKRVSDSQNEKLITNSQNDSDQSQKERIVIKLSRSNLEPSTKLSTKKGITKFGSSSLNSRKNASDQVLYSSPSPFFSGEASRHSLPVNGQHNPSSSSRSLEIAMSGFHSDTNSRFLNEIHPISLRKASNVPPSNQEAEKFGHCKTGHSGSHTIFEQHDFLASSPVSSIGAVELRQCDSTDSSQLSNDEKTATVRLSAEISNHDRVVCEPENVHPQSSERYTNVKLPAKISRHVRLDRQAAREMRRERRYLVPPPGSRDPFALNSAQNNLSSSGHESQSVCSDSKSKVTSKHLPDEENPKATLDWISRLNGGPQPLVSPLSSNISSPELPQLATECAISGPHFNCPVVSTAQNPNMLKSGSCETTFHDCLPESSQIEVARYTGDENLGIKPIQPRDATSQSSPLNSIDISSNVDILPIPDGSISNSLNIDDPKSVITLESAPRKRNTTGDRRNHTSEKKKRSDPVKLTTTEVIPIPNSETKASLSDSSISSSSTPPMSIDARHSDVMEDTWEANIHLTTPRRAKSNEDNSSSGELVFANEALECLFDRLLRLEDENMARKMGKILLQFSDRPPETSNRTAVETSSGCGAEILRDGSPKIIAFDLRKLPLECILKLAEVAAEDESIFRRKRTLLEESRKMRGPKNNIQL